ESDDSVRSQARTLPAVGPRAATSLGLPRLAPSDWSRQFVRQLVLADALCAVIAIAAGWAVRFGFPSDNYAIAYVGSSVLLTLGWLVSLQATGAYDIRRISVGAREFQRVIRAAVNVAGLVAIGGYAAGSGMARAFVAIAFPTGAVLMLLTRYLARQ